MSKKIALIGITVLALSLAAVPAFGAKGGKTQASIAFAGAGSGAAIAPTNGSSVSFAVSSSLASKSVLVVTNRCWRDGVVVYNEYHTVSGGLAGPFTISISGSGSNDCEAYVWAFPDSTTPLSGGWMGYSVTS
jgi:hypothetical protein